MAYIHELDVCDDDQWEPHNFKFKNHLTVDVHVTPVAGQPYPFSGNLTVPPSGLDTSFAPGLPPGRYYYNVDCPHQRTLVPRTVIIS